jgi:hypothetical protein
VRYRSLIVLGIGVLCIFGLVVLARGWTDYPVSNPSKVTALPASLSGQSAYEMKIVGKSDNIACDMIALAGGTLLSIRPPYEIDRQIAIRPPNRKWLYYSKVQYQIKAGVSQRILINPDRNIVYEYTYVKKSDRDQYVKEPFFQGDGIYEFIFSDNLEEDWALIDIQAWCRVRFWKK